MNFYKLPNHIAIIMDGNGRWAQKQHLERVDGHKHAKQSVIEVIEGCIEMKIPYLTLYAFSKENWKRSKQEVSGLLTLLTCTVQDELENLYKNNIKFTFIGDQQGLPQKCQEALRNCVEACKNNTKLHLILAINYSGRWEIVNAAKLIAQDVVDHKLSINNISESIFSQYLHTANIPDPALLIRTSGEMRISNFLLWQTAYTEFFFSKSFWPAFRKRDLYKAIDAYQQRERRFGQVNA